ncbi:hypothetical protein CCR96_08960 [Halochromatium roseum]|nr:hypothetical protein [Halochromatium roseum]
MLRAAGGSLSDSKTPARLSANSARGLGDSDRLIVRAGIEHDHRIDQRACALETNADLCCLLADDDDER